MGPDHFVVCGGNALAYRLVVELSRQYEVPVAAIVPPGDHPHVVQIAKALPGAVVEDPLLSDEAFARAELATARAVAFVDGDDQVTIHAAMRAARIRPGIRIVIRMYNQRMARHIQQLIPNCTVLSASATAAPAFANAALRRPLSVAVDDRALHVAIGADIDQMQALFLVADKVDPADPAGIEMLPETASHAREWMALTTPGRAGQAAALQFLDSEPPVRTSRRSRLLWRLIDAMRFFTSAKLRTILIAAMTTLVVAFLGIWYLARPLGWAAYETLLDVAGSAVPDVYGQPSAVGGNLQRVFQVAITVAGVLLMPVVTAVFVEGAAERRGRERRPSAGIRGHVVIVGLGNTGLRVATLLHSLGVPVVAIERDPAARGIAALRALETPVLVGDAPIAEMLRRAHVLRARAVLALTGDDVANLEAALEARTIQAGLRVVVRLFDDNFAEHVYRQFPNTASRSVSYLAAPAFAAAMMGREVLGTLSVYRKVLLIAELTVDAGSPFAGRPLRDLDRRGRSRVLALQRPQDEKLVWRPAEHSRAMAPGDRVVVAATRAGLGALHTGRDVGEPSRRLLETVRSVEWARLTHARGSAAGPEADVAELLGRAAAEGADSSAWGELWAALYHQGGVYPASYAAVPALAVLAGEWAADRSLAAPLVLAGAIVASGDRPPAGQARHPFDAFPEQVAQLRALAEAALGAEWVAGEQLLYVSLLTALLALQGVPAWGEEGDHLAGDEMTVECPGCGFGNAVVFGAEPPYTTADPADPDGPRGTLEPAEAEGLTGLGARLYRRALADGQTELARKLQAVFGQAECLGCGTVFAVAAAFERQYGR